MSISKMDAMTDVTMRKSTKGDNALVGSFSSVIFRTLAKAPNWHPKVPEDWDDLYEGWSELPDAKEWAIWMALERGRHQA